MRLLSALLFVMAALAVAPGGVARAAPSADDLAAVALTPAEIGSGFTTFRNDDFSQLVGADVPNYTAIYQRLPTLRQPTLQIVAVVLADATALGGVDGVEQAGGLTALQGLGITIEPVTPPEIGEETRMFTLSGSIAGQRVSGDLIAWRHGDVIATIATFGNGSFTSLEYAKAQEAKLAAAGF